MVLSTTSSGVLLNGSHGTQIWHARGLRQGDAPMHFIVVMDALNLLLSKAKDMALLTAFPVGIVLCRLSLYADGVILFLRASAPDAHIVGYMLQLLVMLLV